MQKSGGGDSVPRIIRNGASMLRRFIIFGVFACASAGLPVLYQQNADAVRGLAGLLPEQQRPAALPVAAQQPAPAPVRAPLSGRKVRIAADARGHFTAGFRLNGRQLDAMIDTGATLVAINRSTARRIGIALTDADFRYEVGTANGRARAAGATIARLQIGRIDIDAVEAAVLEDSALDGILIGMSFLRRLDSYRVENGVLVLEQ